jgi:ketosteroid isomerase-like protein
LLQARASAPAEGQTRDQADPALVPAGEDAPSPDQGRPGEREKPPAQADGGRPGQKTAAPAAGKDVSSLADKVDAVSARVEAWRAAWETGDLDAYMAFYAPDARQDKRKGAPSIRSRKKRLWSRLSPARVKLEDVRLKTSGQAVEADMLQEYVDAGGQGDVGVKTLIFEEINGVWLITQEDWSPLPHEKPGH